MIRLLTIAPDELERVRAAGRMDECRGFAAAEPDILPGVVIEDAFNRFEAGEEWFWCAPRLFLSGDGGLIVGAGSFRHAPRNGDVEIGYGVAASCAGRGLASLGAAQMVEEAFGRPEVVAVTAEAAVANRASERVLEKNGFRQTGSRIDPEDGPVSQWRLDRPGPGQAPGVPSAV
ncbi:MAG: GNAT family N-acetyltransferase [Candidatus Aminicenantes bacterium]|nr:GNAT family N-acetyltransferase [Candidatus Aminicenantes bacterium]